MIYGRIVKQKKKEIAAALVSCAGDILLCDTITEQTGI